MLDFIERQVDELGGAALRNLEPDRWPALQGRARLRLRRSLGLAPFPARDALDARIVGVADRGSYTIERLVFVSRPGFLVPALVYAPTGNTTPLPAVVYAVGHWMRHGKAEKHIQAFCAGLVQLGFVVLVMDPIGQGEREARFEDHGHLALLPLGLTQEGLMVWEHMRAIDYLLTRPDVDGARMGITGASGGGLTTMFTAAVDERVKAAVSVCFVTSYRRFLRAMRGLDWNGVGDLCNQVPGVIADLEMAGVGGLIWPRPLLAINGLRDPQFPVDGAREVVERLRPLYERTEPEGVHLHVVDADHGYDQAMREAAYGWFSRWLNHESAGSPIAEPTASILPEGSPLLQCFDGKTISSDGAIHDLIVATARRRRLGPDSTTRRPTTASAICRALDMTGAPAGEGVLAGVTVTHDARIERHMIAPEAGITINAFLIEPAGSGGDPIIVLSDEGPSNGAAVPGREQAQLRGEALFAIEPRGTGETAPRGSRHMTLATVDGTLRTVSVEEPPILEFEVALDCLMLGRSLLGQQVQDILASIGYLRTIRPATRPPLELRAHGPLSSLRALVAAALEPAIGTLELHGLPLSYASIVHGEPGPMPPTAYLFGVLRHFDLGDVLALLADRTVRLAETVDGRGVLLEPDAVRAAYRPAARRFKEAGGHLEIGGSVETAAIAS
ncbi:MAG TPA: prolyl oligopeptidase family serine peptidase [Candidatus Bathyarchaeia archaeon]|nr:prolyl oligopeptidase family serine peptidase [Candidatus Bathyarchaeia archaeon]